MNISQEGIRLIKNFEGFSPTPYGDIAGIMTIGFGHRIKKGEVFTQIDAGEGEEILKHDINASESALNQCLNVDVTQNQFDSLCSLVFNIGGAAFLKSTLLHKLNNGNIEGAADEFLRWDHAGGVESEGLLKRRIAERELFLRGISQV